ncbi:substrate-binding periplasmic protein [Sedimenticola sp.]|uniref:substrate-binding periplasmic protein n=1 Tax=Sedimenticola sp. TaxID=1940285 RepID=UPI003D1456C8
MKQYLIILLTLAFSLSAHGRRYDEVVESGYIRIAVYRDFPPYSFRSTAPQAGRPAGIDIEVGKRIARRLGVRPQWFWLTADENLEDDLRNAVWKGHYLGGGVADVMLRVPYSADFSRQTDESGELKNDKVIIFGPYHRERWTVLRDTAQLPKLSNLAPFRYHKVGVEVDSVPDLTLTSVFGSRLADNVIHYRTLPDAVDALRRGEVAAVAGMRGQIEWRLHQPGGNQAPGERHKFQISDASITQWHRREWDIGAAVKRSYRTLGNALEREMEKLIESGEMASIFAQYKMSYELPGSYLSRQQALHSLPLTQ